MNTISEQIKTVWVVDSNGRKAGQFKIKIGYFVGGITHIIHGGQWYKLTGKTGTRVDTGISVVEMASPDDMRMWIDTACSTIWED